MRDVAFDELNAETVAEQFRPPPSPAPAGLFSGGWPRLNFARRAPGNLTAVPHISVFGWGSFPGAPSRSPCKLSPAPAGLFLCDVGRRLAPRRNHRKLDAAAVDVDDE